MLKVAAETFSIKTKKGTEGRTKLGNKVSHVFTPLQSSVLLLQEGDTQVCLLTSHFMTHSYRLSNIYRRRIAAVLNLPYDNVQTFSSHNHCVAKLLHDQYSFGMDEHDLELTEDALTEDGAELLAGFVRSAAALKHKLVPCTVRYGVGYERRITHNRKGRRADGSTYFMREEDRLLLGEDFCGDIDDDAFVIGFFAENGAPLCFLTQFTGHPVTAFHCDHPVVHGEYPQIACDMLSEANGGVPVLFLQGCAGDSNSKGLLSQKTAVENAADAEKYGHFLGDTFCRIAAALTESGTERLSLETKHVALPYAELPSEYDLERRLDAIKQSIAACDAEDDPGSRYCDGLNFPSNMTIPYRKALMQPIHDWYAWALKFYRENRLHEAPLARIFIVTALRIGDVGIYGMPCEPLMGIGRQLKKLAPMPCTIPCGYMNDTSPAYVPDSKNLGDYDYVSAFYRYTQTMLPYRQPGGDILAQAGAAMLKEMYSA